MPQSLKDFLSRQVVFDLKQSVLLVRDAAEKKKPRRIDEKDEALFVIYGQWGG